MDSRDPSGEERALWRRAMGDVKPLPRRPRAPPPGPSRGQTPAAPAVARPRPRQPAPPPLLEPGDSPGVDRRTAERLRRGELTLEERLDLHGLTQDEAHRALRRFVVRAHDAGRRALLVITGKGTVRGAGVLRAAVPRWLNEAELRPRVLSFTWAQPKDGGTGALYVLLRRRR